MIRSITQSDLPALKQVIDANNLFPGEMLDEMTSHYFSAAPHNEIWLTFDKSGPAALAYCAPERMTSGTQNLLLIAVHPAQQGQGIGSKIVKFLEEKLATSGNRLLLVETSSLPEFDATRQFYTKRGFHLEARIHDFYNAG